MGEGSQLLGDRSERLGAVLPVDAGGELGGEQAARVKSELAAKPGEAVDVAVERG